MNITIYFDVYPWNKVGTDIIGATTTPSKKDKDATRYRVDVTIPDPAKPDKVLTGQAEQEK